MSAPAAATIIEARGLCRTYRTGDREVVGIRDVDLQLAEGALLVLKGVSGSGKSTLLGLLAGLDRPTAGTLVVDGTDMTRTRAASLTRHRRETVGMIFQAFNLLPTLNVMENVCLPALLAGASDAATRRRAGELLDWLGMAHRIDHVPAQLSGGEMQRTAIARALINRPRIILADEPTGNLDSRNGRGVIELLARLNREQGRTVIIATHSDLADAFATARIHLRDGRRIDAP